MDPLNVNFETILSLQKVFSKKNYSAVKPIQILRSEFKIANVYHRKEVMIRSMTTNKKDRHIGRRTAM